MAITGFGYLFWLILGKLLTTHEVGAFSAVFNAALILSGLSTLGLTTAAIKLIPEYQVKNQEEKVRGTAFYALKVIAAINILMFLILFFVAPMLTNAFSADDFKLLAIATLALTAYTAPACYLSGLQLMKRLAITDGIGMVSKAILLVPFIMLGFGYASGVYALAVSFFAVGLYRTLFISHGKSEHDSKEIWSYAIPAFISMPATMFIGSGNIVLQALFTSAAAVGLFTIAFVLTSPIKMVTSMISQAIFPVTSQQWAAGQKQQLGTLATQSLRYSYLVAAPMILILSAFAADFLTILVKAEYAAASGIVPILSVASALSGISSILLAILYTTGNPKLSRNAWIAAGLINLVLMLVLIPMFGIAGNSIALLAAALTVFLLPFWWSKKYLQYSIGIGALLKAAVASVGWVAVVYAFKLAFGNWGLAIGLVAGSLVYLLLLLALRFFIPLDLILLQQVQDKLPKGMRHFGKFFIGLVSRFVKQ